MFFHQPGEISHHILDFHEYPNTEAVLASVDDFSTMLVRFRSQEERIAVFSFLLILVSRQPEFLGGLLEPLLDALVASTMAEVFHRMENTPVPLPPFSLLIEKLAQDQSPFDVTPDGLTTEELLARIEEILRGLHG